MMLILDIDTVFVAVASTRNAVHPTAGHRCSDHDCSFLVGKVHGTGGVKIAGQTGQLAEGEG